MRMYFIYKLENKNWKYKQIPKNFVKRLWRTFFEIKYFLTFLSWTKVPLKPLFKSNLANLNFVICWIIKFITIIQYFKKIKVNNLYWRKIGIP
jgi:hypothetical protein